MDIIYLLIISLLELTLQQYYNRIWNTLFQISHLNRFMK